MTGVQTCALPILSAYYKWNQSDDMEISTDLQASAEISGNQQTNQLQSADKSVKSTAKVQKYINDRKSALKTRKKSAMGKKSKNNFIAYFLFTRLV